MVVKREDTKLAIRYNKYKDGSEQVPAEFKSPTQIAGK
jgi:hypothetical protein